ncbi:MATE family efflux transporter [Zhenpiania hominis]|uniref:MATE family efflux transporter n=1 Tax=Zhenpiania hominis TaxID=2763644 RepID=UPI0039F61984
MSRVKDMTSGKPAKLLLLFSFPLILGNLGQQLYMIVDAIIVGQGVGVEGLAAVGATDWTYWLALWVIQGTTQGFGILIAQYFGEGSREKMRKAIAMSIGLCAGTGVLLTGICLLIARPMLRLLQTPENIFNGASAYLLTMFAGILIVMAYNMAASVLRALGDGRTPLIAIVMAAVTNIALDLLFVFGFHWGVVGAAAATVIAQFIAFLYCFAVLRRMELVKLQRKDWHVDRMMIKRLFSLALPLVLQSILIAAGGMVLQSAINRQGFLFLAGFTATNKVYGLLESSAISLGYAMTTYVAQNYGAGLQQRIRQGVKSGVGIAVLFSVGVTILMILGGKPILSLFIDTSSSNAPKVLEIAYQYLFIMSCLLCALYLLYVFRSTLQGMGNTIIPMLSGLMEFLARVCAALIGARIWGETVLFFAEPGAWIAAAVLLVFGCIWKFRKESRTFSD